MNTVIYFLLGIVVGAAGLLYLHVKNKARIDEVSDKLEKLIANLNVQKGE